MLKREEIPDDLAHLAAIDVSLPALEEHGVASCPVSMAEILEYLRAESSDHESVSESQVQFIRNAQVGDNACWLWSFRESDGCECYVTVAVTPNAEAITGMEQNYFGLSPAQYLIAEYYGFF